MKFSVLMSVYKSETSSFLDRALRSIWDDQSVVPDQIVLVEDGPLTPELYMVIECWKARLGEVLSVVKIETNVGLGQALNVGLESCLHEYVARMDTDDVSVPERFEVQLEHICRGFDVVGGYVSEGVDPDGDTSSVRRVPLSVASVCSYSKFRCPLNHPTVLFRKSAVISAGGYRPMKSFEDYYLWMRMLRAGKRISNTDAILVRMRVDAGLFRRRSGVSYAVSEVRFFYALYDEGLLDLYSLFRNLLVRFPLRVLPSKVVGRLYRLSR